MKKYMKTAFVAILVMAFQGCGENETVSEVPLSSDVGIDVETLYSVGVMQTQVTQDMVLVKWQTQDAIEYFELVIFKEGREIDTVVFSKDENSYKDYECQKGAVYNYELQGFDAQGSVIMTASTQVTINEYQAYQSDAAL